MTTDFNKKNWKKVKFGGVVNNANLTERDPAGEGIEKNVVLSISILKTCTSVVGTLPRTAHPLPANLFRGRRCSGNAVPKQP